MRKRYFGRLLSIVLSATLAFTSAVPAHAMSPTEGEIPDETVTDEDAVNPEVTDEEKPEIPEEQVVLEEPEVTQNLPAQEEVQEEILEVVPEDVQVETVGEANNDGVVFDSYDESDEHLLGATQNTVKVNITYKFIDDSEDPIANVSNPNKDSYTVTKTGGQIVLGEPSLKFYDFSGFESVSEGVTDIDGLTISLADDLEQDIDITVTGTFAPKTYNIYLDEADAVQWPYDGAYEISEPADVADYVGFAFEGWHIGAFGTTATTTNKVPYDSVSGEWVFTPTTDPESGAFYFFSNYTENTYKVTYVLNGSTNNKKNLTSYKGSALEGEDNKYILFYEPTKTGSTFTGWYVIDNESGELSDDPLGPGEVEKTYVFPVEAETDTTIKLSAVFEEDTYHATFALGGGTNTVANEAYTANGYKYGDTIVLEAPTLDHNDFVGWYTDAAFTKALTKNNTTGKWTLKATGDATFYAKWKNYPIKYNLYGGTYEPEAVDVVTSFGTDDIGETITLEKPEKLDYDFGGWYTDSSFKKPVSAGAADGTYEYILKTSDKNGLTFYAKFTEKKSPKRVPITYVLGYSDAKNAAENPTSVIVEAGKDVQLYPATKTGYEFVGWFTDSALENAVLNNTFVINETNDDVILADGKLTFYAKFEPRTYAINYVVDGVTVDTDDDAATYGTTYPAGMANYDVLTGSAFEGWFSDAAFKNKIVPGTTALPKTVGPYTVYGKVTEKIYTFTFHTNLAKDTKVVKKYKKSTAGTAQFDPQEIFGEKVITDEMMDPDPNDDTDGFQGWTLAKEPDALIAKTVRVDDFIGSANDDSASVNPSYDFYAVWPDTADSYTVKFVGGDATADGVNDYAGSDFDVELTDDLIRYKRVDTDEEYTLTGREFVRKGYTLTGWTYINSKNKKVTLKPTATFKNIAAAGETVELTAVWSGPITYTVKVNLDGGKYSGAVALPSKYTYDNGFDLTDLAEPTKVGYAFYDWKVNGTTVTALGKGSGAAETGNVTIVATWTPGTYAVEFEENGGIIELKDGTDLADIDALAYDVPFLLKDYIYTKSGYTFKNWTYTDDDGKVKTIAANGVIKNLISDFTKDRDGDGQDDDAADDNKVTLTANWTPNKYTITYKLNGGKQATSSKNYTADKLGEVFIAEPTKTGYTFAGWTMAVKGEDADAGLVPAIAVGANDDGTGYTFSAGAGDVYGNVTLTANYTPIVYDLNIYSADGYELYRTYEGDPDPEHSTYGPAYTQTMSFEVLASEITQASTSAEGKSVKGFAIKANGGLKYALNKQYKMSEIVSATKPEGNVINLYALTENEKYFVTVLRQLDDNEATHVSTVSYDKSKDYKITPAKITGYDFDEWGGIPNTAELGTDYTIDAKTNALTIKKNSAVFKFAELTATYTSKTYTVTLLPNAKDVYDDTDELIPTAGIDGGVISQGDTEVIEDQDLTELGWTRNGYTLAGFSLTSNGKLLTTRGGLYAKADKNAVVKVYAIWKPVIRTITYNNDATVDDVEDALSIATEVAAIKDNLKSQKFGSAVTLPTLKVTGYKFLGWKPDGDYDNVTVNKAGYATKVNAGNYEAVSFTAEFDENTYKIIVNTNGGTYNGKKDNIVVDAEVKYSADVSDILDEYPVADFKKAGCTAATDFAIVAKASKAEQLWSNYVPAGGVLKSTKDVTLYPQYQAISLGKVAGFKEIYVYDAVNAEGTLTANWTADANAGGYEVQLATNPLFVFGVITVPIDGGDTTTVTVQDLTARKYYVRVRAFKVDSTGAPVYGAWSTRLNAVKAVAIDDIIEYDVDFSGNVLEPEIRKAVAGENILKALGTPKAPGYDFQGWYLDANVTTKVPATLVAGADGYGKDDNVTFYAKFTNASYKVSFSWGAGVTGGAKLSPITVTYLEAYTGTLPEVGKAKKTGYSFEGWTLDGEDVTEENIATKVKSNSTLVAKWVPEQYTVTYDPNYVTTAIIKTPEPVTYGNEYGDDAVEAVNREGYVFDGWFTAKSGGTKVLASTKVTTAKDHTLYAHWTVNSYKVKFVANNPYGTTVSGKMADEVYKYTDNKALTANAYKVANYKFTGWALTESATVAEYADKQVISGYADLFDELEENGDTLELFGVWKPVTYTLTVVIGQGQGNITIPAEYGSPVLYAITSAANYTTAIGVVENKGKVAAAGIYTTSTYTAASEVTDTTKVTGAKTYYVKWVEAEVAPVTTDYTITYNLTNVTSTSSITFIEPGETFTTTLAAEAGYTLDNVTVKMGGDNIASTAYNINTGVVLIDHVTGDVVITAHATEQNP